MEITKTYTRLINKEQNSLLWEMSRESAKAYNQYITLYQTNNDYNFCDKETEKSIKRKYLHSQSFQGSYQTAKQSIISFFEATKKFKTNSKGFSGHPQFPKPDKKIQVLIFKKSAIHHKNGFLLLSTCFKQTPIRIKWDIDAGMPVFATISMQNKQWNLSCVFKEEQPNLITGNGTLAIDLGIKRIATTFDGKNTITYNGKEILSFVQLENKKKAEYQSIKDKRKERYNRKQRRKVRGIWKQINKTKNKKRDALHKYSRYIVNKSINDGIGEIIVGDCRSIHTDTNCGKVNNQKISQGQEQKLYKMIEYKFKRVGGKCSLINESYSTQTCPVCGNRYKPNGREYNCKSCGFKYDRDGVGAINIYSKKVSFGLTPECSGDLASPSGLKFNPQLSYKLVCGDDRSSNIKLPSGSVVLEPPTL